MREMIHTIALGIFYIILLCWLPGCSTIGINTPNGSAHYTRIGILGMIFIVKLGRWSDEWL